MAKSHKLNRRDMLLEKVRLDAMESGSPSIVSARILCENRTIGNQAYMDAVAAGRRAWAKARAAGTLCQHNIYPGMCGTCRRTAQEVAA